MEIKLPVFTRPPELFTGLTNLLILFVCIYFLRGICRSGPDCRRRKVWLSMFVMLALASGWGTFNHCFAAVRRVPELYAFVWQVQTALLNLTVAAFTLGPCYDLQPNRLKTWAAALSFGGVATTALSLLTLRQTGSYLTGFTYYAALCLIITFIVSIYMIRVRRRLSYWILLFGLFLAVGAGVFMRLGVHVQWKIPIDGNTPCHLLIVLAAVAYYFTYRRGLKEL